METATLRVLRRYSMQVMSINQAKNNDPADRANSAARNEEQLRASLGAVGWTLLPE